MSGRFEGRRVLVTGGARGQGRNHAVRFARAAAEAHQLLNLAAVAAQAEAKAAQQEWR